MKYKVLKFCRWIDNADIKNIIYNFSDLVRYKMFNDNDKLRDSIEELEVIMKRTFKELMEKIINFIDKLITKIRRIKWEN